MKKILSILLCILNIMFSYNLSNKDYNYNNYFKISNSKQAKAIQYDTKDLYINGDCLFARIEFKRYIHDIYFRFLENEIEYNLDFDSIFECDKNNNELENPSYRPINFYEWNKLTDDYNGLLIWVRHANDYHYFEESEIEVEDIEEHTNKGEPDYKIQKYLILKVKLKNRYNDENKYLESKVLYYEEMPYVYEMSVIHTNLSIEEAYSLGLKDLEFQTLKENRKTFSIGTVFNIYSLIENSEISKDISVEDVDIDENIDFIYEVPEVIEKKDYIENVEIDDSHKITIDYNNEIIFYVDRIEFNDLDALLKLHDSDGHSVLYYVRDDLYKYLKSYEKNLNKSIVYKFIPHINNFKSIYYDKNEYGIYEYHFILNFIFYSFDYVTPYFDVCCKNLNFLDFNKFIENNLNESKVLEIGSTYNIMDVRKKLGDYEIIVSDTYSYNFLDRVKFGYHSNYSDEIFDFRTYDKNYISRVIPEGGYLYIKSEAFSVFSKQFEIKIKITYFDDIKPNILNNYENIKLSNITYLDYERLFKSFDEVDGYCKCSLEINNDGYYIKSKDNSNNEIKIKLNIDIDEIYGDLVILDNKIIELSNKKLYSKEYLENIVNHLFNNDYFIKNYESYGSQYNVNGEYSIILNNKDEEKELIFRIVDRDITISNANENNEKQQEETEEKVSKKKNSFILFFEKFGNWFKGVFTKFKWNCFITNDEWNERFNNQEEN